MAPEGISCLGLEYFCFENDGLWSSSDEDLIALAKKEIQQIGLIDVADVVDGCVMRQPKAYPVYDDDYRHNLAMIRLDGVLQEAKLDATLLLQVHDELLVEAKASEAEQIAALVKREMEHVYPLRAPLLAEAKWGKSWDEAH